MNRPALFLDRDGVINVDYGYVHLPEDFCFIEGIFELVLAANLAGYLVVVVTNQSGIGRGLYSEDQFHLLTAWMMDRFAEHSAQIDHVYFCPYHAEEGLGRYRRLSPLRKPAPGMLLQARDEFAIDMSRSILIGDKSSDMIAGLTAGVNTRLHLMRRCCDCEAIAISKLVDALDYL